jgi:hypothetical protein
MPEEHVAGASTPAQLAAIKEKSLLTVLLEMETQFHADGWDRPHVLGVAYCHEIKLPEYLKGSGLAFEYECRTLYPLDGPVTAYPPVDVLDSIADMLGEGQVAFPAPDDLVAFYFVSEVWVLIGRDVTKEQLAEYTEAGVKHEIEKHPDRVEMRQLTAIDRADRAYMIGRRRDNNVIERSVYDFKHDSGAVPEALWRMLQAIPELVSNG